MNGKRCKRTRAGIHDKARPAISFAAKISRGMVAREEPGMVTLATDDKGYFRQAGVFLKLEVVNGVYSGVNQRIKRHSVVTFNRRIFKIKNGIELSLRHSVSKIIYYSGDRILFPEKKF